MYQVTFILVVFAAVREGIGVTVLSSYAPTGGSANGATTVNILGEFDNSFQPLGPNVDETKVIFVGSYHEYICDLEKDSTHETQITCYTRPMPYGYYQVCVEIGGEERKCFGRKFYVSYSLTPKISHVQVGNNSNNFAGTPRELITVAGDIYTDIFSPNNVELLSRSNDYLLRRVLAGGADCSLVVDDQSDDLYELRFDPDGQEVKGRFTCKPQSTLGFVGNSNLSFIVSGMGRALPSNTLMRVTAKDKIYMFQTYAEIQGISPSLGSVMGGTEISIFGEFFGTFESSPADVTIMGQPCIVLHQNETEISCLTPPQPAELPLIFSGSRGVFVEKWVGQSASGDLNALRLRLDNGTDGYSSWYQDSTTYRYDDWYTTVKMSGILEILKSDWYKFIVRCDDPCEVFIGNNSLDLVKVVDNPYYTGNSWTYRDSQASEWFYFEEGKHIYYEGIGVNFQHVADLSLGIVRATSSLTNSQSGNVIVDQHIYQWTTSSKGDIQHVSFVNWSPNVGVNEQQTITVESSCFQSGFCASTFYEISHNGFFSGPISADASSYDLEFAINGLMSAGVTVTVTAQPLNATGFQIGMTYEVTFIGGMGDERELVVTGSPDVNVTVTESVKGLPDFENFALQLFGRTTKKISIDASASDVEAAILEIRKATCPGELLGDSDFINYYVVLDFEGIRVNSENGGRVKHLEAFCGLNSLRNPYWLFYTGWSHFTEYNAAEYPYICFAHLGIFTNNVFVRYSYLDSNNVFRWRNFWFPHLMTTVEDQWLYDCLNIEDEILQRYPDDSDIKINRFGGLSRVSSEQNFYIDAFIIASSNPQSTENRIPPIKWQGEVMSDVTVLQANESIPDFEIRIAPYNCAYDFPLIAVYNARNDSNSSEDFSSLSATNWPVDVFVDVSRTEKTNRPMGGTFDWNYYDDEIGYVDLPGISIQSTLQELETLLETVDGFGDMSVSTYGSDTCFRRQFTAKFVSNGGRKGELKMNIDNVMGNDDLSFIYRHISGGILHGPISGDMTREVYYSPQVEVKINEVQSVCSGDCSFRYSEEMTPNISGIYPNNSDVATPVNITGTNLDGTGTIQVLIGGVECLLTAETSTSVVCTPGAMEFGEHRVDVYVGGKGLARHTENVVTFKQNVLVSNVSPLQAFTSGGIPMTITGRGLGYDIQVSIGSQPCHVISASPDEYICTVPMVATTGTVPIQIETSDGITNHGSFTYNNTGLPVLTSVEPTIIYGPGGVDMIINGTGFGDTVEGVTATFDNHELEIIFVSDTSIHATTPYLPDGFYQLKVSFENQGQADTSTHSIPDIEYAFSVTDVQPTKLSLFGGTSVTITGEGFSMDDSIKIGEVPCFVETATVNTLTCVAGSSAVTHFINNSGVHATRGIGYAWNPPVVTIRQGDKVHWSWNLEVTTTLGIMVYQVDTSSDTQYNAGFTSQARSQIGSFEHTFNAPGTYYFSTGYIDNLNFGNLNLNGAVHVLSFIDIPSQITITNHGIDADINIGPSSAIPASRVSRSVSCSPLNSGIPGCNSRKRRDIALSRQQRTIGTPLPMTPEIIKDFIHGHNTARASVTPPASNIILARWDAELAIQAENWAVECVFGHSSNRNHSEFDSVGENVAQFSSGWDVASLANTSVDMWVSENVHYTFSNNSCLNECGHYTQVIWHDSYAVGCAISNCLAGHIVVCQYGRAGNFVGEKPYTEGAPCLNCSAEFSNCDATYNLCVEDNVPTAPLTPENETTPTPADVVTFSICHTPIVTSIYPQSGTVNDTIEIQGNGFGNDSCRVTVYIGDDISCIVTYTNSSLILCSPLPIGEAPIAISFEVSVNILGYGDAFIDIDDDNERRFALIPYVESVEPDAGSIAGGTLITITGYGFFGDVDVDIGATTCDFLYVSYTSIECIAPEASGAGVELLRVTSQGFEAVCDSCTFEYTPTLTSVVSEIEPSLISSDGTQIQLTGTNFFPSPIVIIDGDLDSIDVDSLYDLGNVASLVGGFLCTNVVTSGNSTNCTIPHLSAGPHEVSVYNSEEGFAQISTSPLIVGEATASLLTTIGGTGGGLEIMVYGHGFLSDDLFVTVGGNPAEIVENCTTNMQFSFILPPGENGFSAVLISSNSVQYPSMNFQYSSAITPTITDISPSSGNVGTSVDLHGTLLNGTITIFFGDAACIPTFQNATLITCTTSQPSSGAVFPPILFIAGVGYADYGSLLFSYTTEITSFAPLEGSLGGGNVLTVQGSGFQDGSTVFVGSSECYIISVAYNMIQCEIEETPSMSTREDPVTSFHVLFEGENITVFESVPYDFHFALAQVAKVCSNCQDDLEGLTTATGVPALEAPSSFTTTDLGPLHILSPEASPGYECLGSLLMRDPVAASHFDGYMCVHHMLVEESMVTLLANTASLYIWQIDGSPFTTFTDTSVPPVAYKLKDLTQPIADITVPVEVILDETNTLVSSMNYTFTSTLTPVVTNVSPARGGTGGGTNITITGTGFSNDTSDISVTIDGVVCDVDSSSTTQIVCTTNASNRSIETSVVVDVTGKGRSLDVGAQFFYVDVWSSIYTWGGIGVPGEGAIVEIPEGQDIMIDIDTEVLSVLLINGGRVFFDEKDIELNAERILIMNHGRLEVGTEDKPFEHKGIITLHGHVRSIEIPIYGAKGIGIREGTLDLHGQHVPITWTILAQTAEADQNTIVVKHPVTWKASDRIAIASTGDRLSQRENEEVTISSIDQDGVTIHLVENLKYKHLGVTENMPGGTILETAAEVGLLTRNVVVRGSRHAQWDEIIPACEDGFNPGEFAQQTCFLGRFGEERGSDQFGAQILFHHPSQDTQEAFGRLSYVEMYHMGQAFRLGRYAVHFHLMGDMNYRNYVRGCSIHESFNRAVTIHDTHKALIEKNVVYNAMGGCIFIEDGTETKNIIRENLIIFCRQSTSLQNEDITPAAVWVTNPDNIIEHNVAAGGTHFGFWYRMHDHPSGPSQTTSICPRKVELGSFLNNTVHSQGWFGLWIFQEYTPKEGSCCGCEPNAITAFKGLTAWHCDKGAEFVRTGSVQLRDSLLYNNKFTGIEVKMMLNPLWGEAGIYDSVIIGHTSVSGPNEIMQHGVTLPFTDGWETRRVTFINFDRPGGSVFNTATMTGTCAANCGGFHSRFQEIVYHNVDNIGHFRWEHENYIEDMDGSLTGSNSPKVVIAATETAPPSCMVQASLSHGDHQGMVCPHLRLHRIAWNNARPTSLDGSLVNLTNAYGTTQVPFEKKRMTHAPGWMALGFDGLEYQWTFVHLPRMSNITYTALFSNYRDGDCNIITHQLTSDPDRFNIVPGQDKNSTDAPLACGVNEHGDYYFDDTTKTLQYIITGQNLTARRRRSAVESSDHWADPLAVNRLVSMNTFRCYFQDCIPPPDPNSIPPARQRPDVYDRWSDVNYWPDATLPVDGEDVTIPTGDWVVADTTLPNITTLWLDGVLEFENIDENTLENRNFTLRVGYIVIRGGRLIIGWEDNLFRGFVDIILTGTRFSDELPLTQDITVGAKAIGAFGGLDLHGNDVTTVWCRLAETASAGSAELLLNEKVDWREGQEILITPTGFNPWEGETFKIVGVRVDAATNNTILDLNDTLQYDHLAKDYSYANVSFRIAAEVGLLSRNIRIIGDEYVNSDEESFGGRILVGKLEKDDFTFIGYARIENVEFVRMGQEGYTEKSDPRFSLAYSNTGTADSVRPSYVKNCAFVRNFNTAYGAFGANSITFSDNIIYHTVGPSIRVDGLDNRIENNLVSLMINPGTYNGKTNFIWYWFGAVQVFSATSVILRGNVVAGSERAAYWIPGEECDNVNWGVNVARASLYGVYINRFGQSGCTKIRNFLIHHSYDFGIYYQDSSNAEIEDCIITDCGVGIITLFNGPSSAAHIYQNKYAKISNVAVVAVTEQGICPSIDTTAGFMQASPNARPPNNVNTKTIGILAPSFMSAHNNAPKKPFAGLLQYPALGGKMLVEDSTFINFGDVSCSLKHHVISTNSKNEDYHHPIYFSKSSFYNTPTNTKVFYERPSLGKINPSDCVDMECDGHKNIIITDLDGTFLEDSPGDIIPQAEYEWNGTRARGLRDERIPITLRTYPNGSRIPVDKIAPEKGILRANSSTTNCIYREQWQAYECHGYDHQLFLIESLDADSETRRLSPVALLADGYVDLENGPQDHGWCAGYTCQLRLSTFFTTTAIGYTYEIHFTGTSPNQLRLRLPHAGPDDAVVACIFYSTSNRLDVYYGGVYQIPTNGYYQNEKLLTRDAPDDEPDLYQPNVTSPAGTNHYTRLTQTICVTVRGPSPVDIKVSPAIYLGFGLPAVTTDEFFENILFNLAALLQVPESNVWVVDVIREGTRRRKREEMIDVLIAVGEQPSENSTIVERSITRSEVVEDDNGTVTIIDPGEPDPSTLEAIAADEAIRSGLEEARNIISATFESGHFNEIVPNASVENLFVTSPPSVVTAENPLNDSTEIEPTYLTLIGGLEIINQPDGRNSRAGETLPGAPVVHLVDEFGHPAYPQTPWVVTASVFSGDISANISGGNVTVVNGEAVFDNLVIDTGGSFRLQFTASYEGITRDNFTAVSDEFSLRPPRVPTNCTSEEGDDYFDKEYVWEQANCSHLCIYNCDGSDESCVDVICGSHSQCINHECQCGIFDFDPHLPENLERTLEPEVTCGSSYIKLTINKCGANLLGFNLEKMFVFGDGPVETFHHNRGIRSEMSRLNLTDHPYACQGRVENHPSGLKYVYIIRSNLNQCNPDITDNGTHIIYDEIMRGYKTERHGAILRDRPIEVKFTCVYESNLQSVLPSPIEPYISVISIGIESEGSFNITMRLWQDENYTVPMQSPSSILVPDPVYVSVAAIGINSVVLSIENCTASSSDDPATALSVLLIENGCANTAAGVTITEIGTSNEVKLWFPSFILTTQDPLAGIDGSLYLQCYVIVCSQDLGPCTPSCNAPTRRKRDADGEAIMLGPIPVGRSYLTKRQSIDTARAGEGIVGARWIN